MLFGSSDGPGSCSAVGDGGYDFDSDELITVDSDAMDPRFDFRFTLSPTRSRGAVTLEVLAKQFGCEAGGYAARCRVRVHIQKKQDSAWADVASATADGAGVVKKKLSPKKATWRAVVDDSSTVWGGETGGERL